ncbi:MAG: methylcobalamin:coenzyme M methyltransferase [Lentisphaerae bacterium ADurb.BinA184]|nr:MAG: methylcobalamin:coenzyme M methyltransferase [Lentisphaerae bacterium ADurb.BinA184]
MKPTYVLHRREPPDHRQFLKVLDRRGDRGYVPFFEMIPNYFAELSGVEPPPVLDFTNRSPHYLSSFGFYFQAMARMGFDLGIINLCGFRGFPGRHPAGKVQAGDGAIATWADFEAYPWPGADQINVETMAATARLAPEGMGVWTGGPAPFQVTMDELLGFDRLAFLLYDDPGLVRAIADRIGAIMVDVIDLCCSLPFIAGFEFSGDMGHKTATMVSPDALRTYFLPWHRKACEAAHRHGKKIILHSCGNLAAIMDDVVACGYDGKHSFEDTIEPGILDLHARYGRRLALLGGVDVNFLCQASEEAIRRRVRELIDAMAPAGGYCLGSGNSVPAYVPIEKYWAMLDEGLRYGRAAC